MNAASLVLPEIQLDADGLLVHPETWTKEIALVLANDLGIIPLNSDHWKIISALRNHYEKFGVAPAMHNICHASHHSDKWMHDLFLTCFNAWRVAGLPDPGEEAKAYLNGM